MIVVGSAALQRKDGAAVHAAVCTLAQEARVKSGAGEDWRVLNILHRVRSPHSTLAVQIPGLRVWVVRIIFIITAVPMIEVYVKMYVQFSIL